MNAQNLSDGPSPSRSLPTHRIELGGEVRYAYAAADVMPICDELFEKYGSTPKITDLNRPAPPSVLATVSPAPADAVAIPATVDRMDTPSAAPVARIMSGEIDILGKARSESLKAAGEATGFSFRETVYARGKPVIALGEENAKKSMEEHEAMPYIGPACLNFREVIRKENRRDVISTASGIKMDVTGRIALPDGTRIRPTEEAFAVFCNRLGIGGGAYLNKCWPRLRALNICWWTERFDQEEKEALALYEKATPEERKRLGMVYPERDRIKFRLRDGIGPDPEVYGVVSPSYTAFNVDKIAEAIQIAMPPTAKAEFNYDGHRTSFDILFHSNVQPNQYVAGEFFKAGIRVKASDSGDGSIVVSAIVWQNLCLNLLIIDQANKPLDRIRHIGSVSALANRLRRALDAGKDSLRSFLTAWDYALDEHLTVDHLDVPKGVEVPVRFEDALPGIFNGLYERELVPLRKPKESIPLLMRAWEKDTSKARGDTRAAVVNAITRFAHESNSDPWYEDELERAAGSLLTLKAPRSSRLMALPYVPLA